MILPDRLLYKDEEVSMVLSEPLRAALLEKSMLSWGDAELFSDRFSHFLRGFVSLTASPLVDNLGGQYITL